MSFLAAPLILLAPLLAPPAAQEETPPAPDPDRVAATLADLDASLGAEEAQVVQRALERASQVPHPDVVDRVRKALRDPRKEVRQSAISALRYLDHPDALKALHRLAKDRKLMRDREYAPWILRAIGQHGDASSLPILAADPTKTPFHEATRARILGLGNIRSTESIDALIEWMGATGMRRRSDDRRYAGFENDFRMSLIVLTGTDQGTSPDLWARWWRNNKKGFELAPEEPRLPKSMRAVWDSYWGRRALYDREKRREERGT